MAGLLQELRRQISNQRRDTYMVTPPNRVRPTVETGERVHFGETVRLEKRKEVAKEEPKTEQHGVSVERPVDPSVGNTQERDVEAVSKEDFLLNQIDEFRERAKQLQDLMDSKESQARELQTLVDERQTKADELQTKADELQTKADELGQIVEENQKLAEQVIDGSQIYTDQVTEQVIQENQKYADQVMQENQKYADQVVLENQKYADQVAQENQKLAGQVIQENQRYADQVAQENQKLAGQLVQENQKFAGQMAQESQKLATQVSSHMDQKLDALVARVSTKMEEVTRSMQSEISGNSQLDEETSRKLNEGFTQLETMTQELKEAFAQVEEQLTGVKVELSDKVHSENVKSYRNVSDLFRNMEDRTDCLPDIEKNVGKSKKFGVVTIVVSVLNLLAILGLLMMNLGLAYIGM